MDCRALLPHQLPHTPKLFRDYVEHFHKVQHFFEHPPELKTAAQLAHRLNFPMDRRREVSEILRAQNRQYRSGEATFKHLDLLAEGAVAVVTGQQVGFLSGPAFTLYKALTAVRLAQLLSEQGLPSVPVFWLATEDHDLEEVAATAVLDDDYNLVPLRDTGVRPAPHSSVGYVQLSGAVTETLDALGGVRH